MINETYNLSSFSRQMDRTLVRITSFPLRLISNSHSGVTRSLHHSGGLFGLESFEFDSVSFIPPPFIAALLFLVLLFI
jgi:hypothetical protein